MARAVRIAAVQAPPLPIGTPLDVFVEHLHQVVSDDPGIDFVVYPELHLFGPEHADPGNEMRCCSLPQSR
jgi:hypothetical protein